MIVPRTGLSKRVPRMPIKNVVDVAAIHGTKIIFVDLWDWPGKFWRGPIGSMQVIIDVRRPKYEARLDCIDGLQRYLEVQFDGDRRYHTSKGGDPNQVVSMVIAPDPQFGGSGALRYHRETTWRRDGFAVPVSEKAYLIVHVSILAVDERYSVQDVLRWESRAKAVRDAVIRSIKLEGPWERLSETCVQG